MDNTDADSIYFQKIKFKSTQPSSASEVEAALAGATQTSRTSIGSSTIS
ncbi:MAG: hypothetical protein IPM82_29445 [Saprospiraceae bacterium]|nr:hypothetical protein [Saprospiraceae bacterium]